MKNYATIDIGTNTILMLVGYVNDKDQVVTLRDEHRIARLGEKLKVNGFINDEAIKRASVILTDYSNIIKECNVTDIKAIATSAIRESNNQKYVLDILNPVIGTNIEVVPGEVEGDLTFLGTINDNDANIVIDIGGGSTEIIYGNNSHILDRVSFKIGAVKLTETFFSNYTFNNQKIAECTDYVKSILQEYDFSKFSGTAYAVAGTPTTIAMVAENMTSFDASIINNYIINEGILNYTLNVFSKKNLDYLVNVLKIDSKRADLMLAGNILLKEILKILKLSYCKVSIYGLRYGIMKKYFPNKQQISKD